jgi:hypothetical protein
MTKRKNKPYCVRWGGLNEADFDLQMATIKDRLIKIKKFVRTGLGHSMYQAENVVSLGHELEHDHVTLTHIRSELDWLISELIVERSKIDRALARVNAGVG